MNKEKIKRKVMPWGVMVMLVLSLMTGFMMITTYTVRGQFAGGSGTSGSPYQIANWTHMNATRDYLSSYFILLNNLTSSTAGYDVVASSSANDGAGWLTIAPSTSPKFTGNFNGDGYELCDMFLSVTSSVYRGLFGYSDGAVIANLTLRGANFTDGNGRLAGIVGSPTGGTVISNVHVFDSTFTVTGANGRVGSFFSYASSTALVIENCSVDNVTITNWDGDYGYIGGIGGWNQGLGGIIRYCTVSNLTINSNSSLSSNIGGLVGDFSGTIHNCHVINADIYNPSFQTGGLVGAFGTAGGPRTIHNCSFQGTVEGLGASVGGIVGKSFGNITDTIANVTLGGEGTGLGGIAGYLSGSGVIKRCAAFGATTGITLRHAGLIGDNFGTVVDSYSTASVTTTSTGSTIAAFSGYSQSSSNISNCYAAGAVDHPSSTTKGFHGATASGYACSGNFWDNETTDQTSGGGNTVGKNTSDMKSFETFNSSGWDIIKIEEYDVLAPMGHTWYIDEGNDYPRLWFEYEIQETVFNLSGLTGNNITWAGGFGNTVWCNSTGSGHETLEIFIACNSSINVTQISIWLDDLTKNGDTIGAGNITLFVSSDNSSFGQVGAYTNGGSNLTLNATSWNAGTMGSNPFPVNPGSTATLYARFRLAIPVSGITAGVFESGADEYKVYIGGYNQG